MKIEIDINDKRLINVLINSFISNTNDLTDIEIQMIKRLDEKLNTLSENEKYKFLLLFCTFYLI